MSKNAEVLPPRTAWSATRQPSLATLTRQPAYIEPLRNESVGERGRHTLNFHLWCGLRNVTSMLWCREWRWSLVSYRRLSACMCAFSFVLSPGAYHRQSLYTSQNFLSSVSSLWRIRTLTLASSQYLQTFQYTLVYTTRSAIVTCRRGTCGLHQNGTGRGWKLQTLTEFDMLHNHVCVRRVKFIYNVYNLKYIRGALTRTAAKVAIFATESFTLTTCSSTVLPVLPLFPLHHCLFCLWWPFTKSLRSWTIMTHLLHIDAAKGDILNSTHYCYMTPASMHAYVADSSSFVESAGIIPVWLSVQERERERERGGGGGGRGREGERVRVCVCVCVCVLKIAIITFWESHDQFCRVKAGHFSDPITYTMHRSKLLPNSTLPIVNFHEERVKIQLVEPT